MQRLARAPALGFALFALASCTSFEFERQALALRHLPGEDALELRIVYLGLNAGDAKPAEAAATLAAIAGGAKHFLIAGWPFEFGPEFFEDAWEEDETESVRRFAGWLSSFEVVDAGVYLEGDGFLCGWQLLRLPRISEGLDAIGRIVDESLLEDHPRDDKHAPFGDPALIPRFREAARSGTYRWASLDERTLRIAFPISPAGMAELARAMAEVSVVDRTLRGPLRALSTLEVRDGEAVLRFEPDEAGWIELGFDFPDREASPEIAAAVLALAPATQPPDWARELASRVAPPSARADRRGRGAGAR